MLEFLYFVSGCTLTLITSGIGWQLVERSRRHITWKRFGNAISKTVAELRRGDWRPDVVVGVNSGIVPASILALNLRVPELIFYESFPEYKGELRIQPAFRPQLASLKDKKVLIVDDQTYTGRTLEGIMQHLLSVPGADPQNIKRYVVFRFRSGAGPVAVDIPPAEEIGGNLKKVPWVFATDLEKFWKDR